MSEKSDRYRARARECQDRAEKERDPEGKRKYKELARQWIALADHTEREQR